MLPLLPRIEFASLKNVTRGPSHKTVLVLRSHIFEPQKCIYWSTFLPGRANPCPIISEHGILMTCFVFPFQILGGLSGAIFMKKYFWPLGMTLFHSTINATVSKGQSHRRNDFWFNTWDNSWNQKLGRNCHQMYYFSVTIQPSIRVWQVVLLLKLVLFFLLLSDSNKYCVYC